MKIPLPPLAEQRRIAEVLDRAEALRTKRRAALAQLDSLTQSLFLDLFGDPVANPKRWPNPTLGGLLTFQQYGPRFFNESYSADGIRIVRITDLSESGTLDFSAMPRLTVSDEDREKYSLRPGDLIFARTGATVGKVALMQPGDPPCIAGAYFITMRFEMTLDRTKRVMELAVTRFRRNSPLALPFEEAVVPSRFLSQVTAAAENQLRGAMAAHANRAMGMALATAKVVLDAGQVRVVFEGGIPAGARLMKAAGKHLPTLVDGKTGKILSIGRVASKGRVVASAAASAALIVVEAAHMISGADNAKRIKHIERRVDFLIHAHESELKSRLEGIYRYSKELLHQGARSLSEDDRRELHRQCRDLMELRARWREDFRRKVSQIDPTDPGWGSRTLHWFRREDAGQKNREAKAAEAEQAMQVVQLMHFSLLLQLSLAGAAGRIESFQQLTLPDEAESWRALSAFGRTRVEEITGKPGALEFTGFLNELEGIADFWTPLHRENRPLNVLAKADETMERSTRTTVRRKKRVT